METYKFFVVPIGNTKIKKQPDIQVPNYSVTPNNNMEQLRDDLYDK